jgi:hypothetical protein
MLRRLAAGAALGAALWLTEAVVLAQGSPPGDPIVAARALFAEALGDEHAGRYGVALEKFLRVRDVKDTASIEYRIGTCHEGLGHLPAAYDAYGAAVVLGAADPSMADVVTASRGRHDALSKHVARLTLVLPDAADAQVQVDDVALTRDRLDNPVPLEPGGHTVTASAAGRVPFRSQIALPEGGEASLAVSLPPVSPTPSPTETSAPGLSGEPAPSSASTSTLGWILVGTSGVLAVGSVVTLVLRHSDIATIEADCPGGTCPSSDRTGLESTRDRALAEGPLGAGMAAAAAVTGALGIYFLLSGRSSRPPAGAVSAPTAPTVRVSARGIVLGGSF